MNWSVFPTGTVEYYVPALVSMPLAAVLGSALAFRPRRRGTPLRRTDVIHAQILLAVVGALVMVVIGESLARAFGVVGIAGLIRYRSKVRNAKDAGVMLSTLAIGLAAGAGLYGIAVLATAFFLLLLWIIESREPRAYQAYRLKVASGDPGQIRPRVEAALKRHRVNFELRSSTDDELAYVVQLPFERKTNEITADIAAMGEGSPPRFEWELKKR
jgi:hypothetical protein